MRGRHGHHRASCPNHTGQTATLREEERWAVCCAWPSRARASLRRYGEMKIDTLAPSLGGPQNATCNFPQFKTTTNANWMGYLAELSARGMKHIYASIYLQFPERQIYRDRKISGCQGLGSLEHDGP